MLTLALPLLVIDSHHSDAQLGLAAARMVPMVALLIFGGAITDRISRRVAMLIADGARGATTLVLGLVALVGSLSFVEILLGAVLLGVFDALFLPASTAMLPDVVPSDLLTTANSVTQVSRTLAPLLGVVLAGVIAPSWALVIDAGTFAISALFLALMRPTPRLAPSGNSMLSEIREGLAFCRRVPWLWITLVLAGMANALVFTPAAILVILLLTKTFATPHWQVGVVLAAGSLGGAIGAIAAGRRRLPRRRVRAMLTAWILACALFVLVGLAPTPVVVAVLFFVSAPLLLYGNVVWESLLQTEVPRALLGRVSSIDWIVSLGLSPLGVALAGVAAGTIGVRPTIVIRPSSCRRRRCRPRARPRADRDRPASHRWHRRRSERRVADGRRDVGSDGGGLDRGRRRRPCWDDRARHGCELGARLRDHPPPRRPRRARAPRVSRRGTGSVRRRRAAAARAARQRRGAPVRSREPRVHRRAGGTPPHRGALAVAPRQQRRGHGRRRGQDRGRLRDALWGQPPRPFALTRELLPLLQASPSARVVTMSSAGHRVARLHFDDPMFERHRYRRWAAYVQSKLANLLFTAELARRLDGTGTAALAAHPGIAHTQLGHEGSSWSNAAARFLMPFGTQSAAMGARPAVRAATDPSATSGEFYGPRLVAYGAVPVRETPSRRARRDGDARRLWALSESLTHRRFDVPTHG